MSPTEEICEAPLSNLEQKKALLAKIKKEQGKLVDMEKNVMVTKSKISELEGQLEAVSAKHDKEQLGEMMLFQLTYGLDMDEKAIDDFVELIKLYQSNNASPDDMVKDLKYLIKHQ